MTVSRRSLIAGMLALGTLPLAACGGSGAGGSSGGVGSGEKKKPEDILVGLAMPTKSSERWIEDGENLKKQLEDRATRSTSSTPRTTSPRRSTSSTT